MWYQDLTTAAADRAAAGARHPARRHPAAACPGVPGVLYETNASFVNFIRDRRARRRPGRLPSARPHADPGRRAVHGHAVRGRPAHLLRPARGRPAHHARGRPARWRSRCTIRGCAARSSGAPRSRAGSRASTPPTAAGAWPRYQHVIEPRVRVIEIRGIDQKAYPNYDPGASTATGIDPGYERRTGIDRLGKANEIDLLPHQHPQRQDGGRARPDRPSAGRWSASRSSQTYKMDPVAQPFKDLYGDLTFQPNQRIGFHADARYNVYDLGLREANADIRLIYPRVSRRGRPALQRAGQYPVPARGDPGQGAEQPRRPRGHLLGRPEGAGDREPDRHRLALQLLVRHRPSTSTGTTTRASSGSW